MDKITSYKEFDITQIKSLFNNSLSIVYILDINGNIQNINDTVTRILGLQVKDCLGLNINDLLYKEEKEGPRFVFPLKYHHEDVFLERALDSKGDLVELEILCTTFSDPKGNIIGYIGMASDLTKERKIARQFELLSQKYKSLFDNTPHFVCMINEEGIITETNRKMDELFGNQYRGKHFSELLYNQDSPLPMMLFQEALQGNTIEDTEIVKDKNGQPIYVEYRSIPVLVENKVVGVCIAAKDITEKVKLEKLLENDLHIASLVQKSVLSEPIINERLSITGHFIPANNIGGDMYVWRQLDDGCYAILMIDVVGHGVSSALISMSIRSLFEGIIYKTQNPELVMEELNQHMFKLFNHKSSLARFFTSIFAVVDTNKKEIRYINAGHPAGILLKGDNSRLLPSTCPPLGILNTLEFTTNVITYQEPIMVLLFTDGLVEHLGEHSSITSGIEIVKNTFIKDKNLGCKEYLSELNFNSLLDDVSMIKVDIY